MSEHAPGEEQLIQHYRELSETVSGEATVGKQNTEVARRIVAEIKADAWDEGWSAGYTDAVDDEHPQATGRHEPNPYRVEQENAAVHTEPELVEDAK